MEAYVSFKVAELLKEKEFEQHHCAHSYDSNGVFKWSDDLDPYEYSAPTHQMARAWLRDIHNIDIDIDSEVDISGRKVYVPSISTYKPIENADTDMFRQFKRCLYYDDDNGFIPATKYFHSYEEAVEESLKYVLENLI